MKIDLHVHSKFSKRPSEWILKKLGCPESFTDPFHLYNIAVKRGMSLVTITDHNTIDGCLEIDHLAKNGKREKHMDTKVAHFTDTFYEVNGVAGTLKRQIEAARRTGKKYCVVTCDPADHTSTERIRNFKPIGAYEVSVYPEQRLFYPPVLEIIDYCYNESFTHIHSATPGPLGLAALAVARILKLPLVGTYHTALPQYAQYLTEDASITELIWKYVMWYYDQMDLVYVPSRSTAAELADKGIASQDSRLSARCGHGPI